MDSTIPAADSLHVHLSCLRASPDGTTQYIAQQPGDLRLFCEALRANPQIATAVTCLQLSIEYDDARASGILGFAEDLRREYGIDASGGDVAVARDEGSDSDSTIVLSGDEEQEETDHTAENKENIAPCSSSPEGNNVHINNPIIPVSPPASTTDCSPSSSEAPEDVSPEEDPWYTAIADFEAMKRAGNIDSEEEAPIELYLGFVLSVLKCCKGVTALSLPVEWRAHVGERVKEAFRKLEEVRWRAEMGEEQVESLGRAR